MRRFSEIWQVGAISLVCLWASCIFPSRVAHPTIVCSETGALTVSDMEALFKPVPFGESRISPLTQATAPDVLPIWDLFRNIDEDKQNRTLQVFSSSLC